MRAGGGGRGFVLRRQDEGEAGQKPYWSTNSRDGNYCFVSWSGTDSLSALSYDSETEVARIQVGDHPQRVRNGVVRTDLAIAGI